MKKIKISGEAGDGIVTLGSLILHASIACGFNSTAYKSYPSNLRSGYSFSIISLSEENIFAPLGQSDIIISFNAENLQRDLKNEKKVELLFKFENDEINDKEQLRHVNKSISIPIHEFKTQDLKVKKNIIVFGILCSLFKFPRIIGENCIKNKFYNRSNDIYKSNLSSYNLGYNWISNIGIEYNLGLKINHNNEDNYILNGNQLLSIGAIYAGCKFYSSYPITPATSIGEFLGKHIVKFGGYAYQAEDEIAALSTVIGASFNGVKSMTATSGPGLSLMQELIGFAAMIELPVVIVDIQRGGPSTGMPTKHEQSDLLAAVFGSHGESPRIVLSPTDLEDNYYLIIETFNLAEKYQCPVILLSDASLATIESNINFNEFDRPYIYDRKISDKVNEEKFYRYEITNSGINELLIPGKSVNTYTVTGVEHNEDSNPDLTPQNRINQMNKRFGKIANIENENPDLIEWDLNVRNPDQKYDISIISWGLSASTTKEAVRRLRKLGYKVAALYLKVVYPLFENSIYKLLSMSEILFVPETNYSGQLAKLIKMNINTEVYSFLKSTGEPFTPEEIENEVIRLLNDER